MTGTSGGDPDALGDANESFLFVTQYFPPEQGAAQVRLGSVTRALAGRGHRVEVLTAIPNYPTGKLFEGWSRRPVQRSRTGDIRVTRVWVWAAMGSGLGRLANYLSFGLASAVGAAWTKRATWTVVEYPTLFGALPAVVLARLRRRRLVVNVADLWVDALVALGALPEGRAARLALRLERAMLVRADAVNAVTEGVHDALIDKGVDPERLCWLPNGADTHLFAPGEPDPADVAELDLDPEERVFLYAGTHGYVHGLSVVLDAAEQLRDVPARFLLVGGGSEKPDLVADAEARGLDNVTFWDPVAPERVASLLRLSTAGLACTRRGDLYRSIRSAKMLPVMSAAIPVLYSGDDEGAALVADAGAGLATPAGDAAALADAVRAVLDDPAAAADMGRRGRAYIEAEASWEAIVGRWLDQLRSLDSEDGR